MKLKTWWCSDMDDALKVLRSIPGYAPLEKGTWSRCCALRMCSHSAKAVQLRGASAFEVPHRVLWEQSGIRFTQSASRDAAQKGRGMGSRLTARTFACPAYCWMEQCDDGTFVVYEWPGHTHSDAGDSGTYVGHTLTVAASEAVRAVAAAAPAAVATRDVHNALFGGEGRVGRASPGAVAAAIRRAMPPQLNAPPPPSTTPSMASLLWVIHELGAHGISVVVKPVGCEWTATANADAKATGWGKAAALQFLQGTGHVLTSDVKAAVLFTEQSCLDLVEVTYVSLDQAFRVVAHNDGEHNQGSNTCGTCVVGYSKDKRDPVLLALIGATAQVAAAPAWGMDVVMKELRNRGLPSNVEAVHSDVVRAQSLSAPCTHN